MEDKHFTPSRDYPEDVDGNIMQEFTGEDGNLVLESDTQIDYVAIISDVKLSINCLHEWTTES